jgi:elongation factor P
VAGEGFSHRQMLRFCLGGSDGIAPTQRAGAGCLCRNSNEGGAIGHHRLVWFAGAIPLDHGELRRVQWSAFAIAEDMGEVDDAFLASGEKLLHREFWRRVQIAARARPVRANPISAEGMKMSLVAGRNLEGGSLNLDEAFVGEPATKCSDDAVAGEQKRSPVAMTLPLPERRNRHASSLHSVAEWLGDPLARPSKIANVRAELTAASGAALAIVEGSLKVIASQVRKGNVVEVDNQLFVVLTAENFHPGKGTPTTQIDMRRISDGVKVSQRYKTTEQLERAFVDDHDYQYLYQDADGFTFMNGENFEQVTVSKEILGDLAPYLQENMKVRLSLYNGIPISIELPQRVTLEVVETEPTMKGQTASSSYKPALLSNGVKTLVPGFIVPGTRIIVMTEDGSYAERAKD